MQRIDPFTLAAATWQGRKAALVSRAVPPADPRIVECDAALAVWRVRRAIDAEHDVISADVTTALTELLRDAVALRVA